MEKFLGNPRHIEIRCSPTSIRMLSTSSVLMQRRHQKIIEEAPGGRLTARADANRRTLRRSPPEDRLCGAGTFEFLFQTTSSFIEMNTRLQVEHPVTELTTGIDLVQEQIRVAAGQKLRFRQRDIERRGHAIECRINAEDPYTFVPSPGRITSYHAPGGPGIRVDSHVYHNYFVPPYYDSMIGKVIAYGDTRDQAIARMRIALSEMVVEGTRRTFLAPGTASRREIPARRDVDPLSRRETGEAQTRRLGSRATPALSAGATRVPHSAPRRGHGDSS
jgi:acetyl-CoA carboxylase biotin carboxylase subunit